MIINVFTPLYFPSSTQVKFKSFFNSQHFFDMISHDMSSFLFKILVGTLILLDRRHAFLLK
ncbi:hypothetical protein L6D_22830 [Enterococcus faecalis]|nr:hypothetical protein L6D_22830 [Enterococcus faecalis]